MADNLQAPGVQVREKRSGAPLIRGGATNIGGFIVRTLRGPVGRAVRVTSFPQFQRIYGSYDINSYAAESVKAFFDNEGSACYIVRVLGSSGGTNAKAAVTFSSNAGPTAGSFTTGVGALPHSIPTGTALTLTINGTPYSVTVTGTKGFLAGVGGTFAAVPAGASLQVGVTGKNAGVYSAFFDGTENTVNLFANKINEQIPAVTATVVGGQLRLETAQTGAGANVQVFATTTPVATSTGIPVGTLGTAGTGNVPDITAVTATDLAAILSPVVLTGSVVANSNGTLTVTSNTTGTGSTVTPNAAFNTLAGTSGTYTGTTSGNTPVMTFTAVGEGSDCNNYTVLPANTNSRLSTSIPTTVAAGPISSIVLSQAVANRITKGDTLLFSDSAGSASIRVIVQGVQGTRVTFASTATVPAGGLPAATTIVTLETFSITVYYNGNILQGPVSGLRMSALSDKDYFYRRINTVNDENAVSVTDAGASFSGSDLRPVPVLASVGDAMTGGSEALTFADADWIGDATAKTGLQFTMPKDLRLLAMPGITGTNGAVTKALVQMCETKKRVFAVTAAPLGSTPQNMVDFKRNYIGSSSYGGSYGPWVQINSPITGQPVNSPPEGYVMGMIARSDATNGVQKAPAGELTGKLVGTIGMEYKLSDDDRALIYPENINPIEDIPNVGQCVMGSRTMEDGEFNQIHVRRTFIYLEEALKNGTRWVVFEENTPATRSKLLRSVSAFLEAEWRKGTLTGKTIGEAFWNTCDDSNNPPAIVNQQLMILDTGVNIPKTTEILIINIQQDQRGQGPAVAA